VLRDRVTGEVTGRDYGGRLREGRGGREKGRGREGDRKWVTGKGNRGREGGGREQEQGMVTGGKQEWLRELRGTGRGRKRGDTGRERYGSRRGYGKE
jgi:hypothetical protein